MMLQEVHRTNSNHSSSRSSRRRILNLLIMPKYRVSELHLAVLLVFFILLKGRYVIGDSIDTDKQVLLDLRLFLKDQNYVDRGKYTLWNPLDLSPCNWPGITCNNSRVTQIDLSHIDISGHIYSNFSALTELVHLDLSGNSLSGPVPADLGLCQSLKSLNLSHNIIAGELNFTGLNNLETLDLSENRIQGDIQSILPRFCSSLVVANVSSNNLTGEIGKSLDGCLKLQYVDFSANHLRGEISFAFQRLKHFQVSQNNLSGRIQPWVFSENCSLEDLDLSENLFIGELPKEISLCKNLVALNLWGNRFSGKIPLEIGSLVNLQALIMGKNRFHREIPESLIDLKSLSFLDLSNNNFRGQVQEIFGRITQVKYLLLHGNSYTGGLDSSGIFTLPNVSRVDLSKNKFTGQLPIEFSQMSHLKYLFLSFNNFTGNIPPEYGNFEQLQALDLSHNRLNGSVPQSLGKLNFLLWLMLANNELSGEIPAALGNCSSLLWLNLANNQISGKIPHELASIGNNPMPTFLLNRDNDQISAGSGECSAMKRWIPANYPPFSFVYTVLTMKKCRSLWDTLLKGYGLFSVCSPGTSVRTNQISGYLQLGHNQLSGELPREIEQMKNFSMLHLGNNRLEGKLPAGIKNMPLMVLNITGNNFAGEIPAELGSLSCLQGLDLSYNNFSGAFPYSLSRLNDLNKFNISYNPYISGSIPTIGQFATFEKWSFVGDPLLRLPHYMDNTTKESPSITKIHRTTKPVVLVILVVLIVLLVFGIMSLIICVVLKRPEDSPNYIMEGAKERHDRYSSSGGSSPWFSNGIKVIRLDKTAFTHKDILAATGNFSNDRIIGQGGFGTVYRGMLPDGREVAVKKQQREGIDAEREFRAEMEVLTGNGFGWPHPNLVTLYGWCLDGSEKYLVYEYMVGGSLEGLISDRKHLTWRHRINVALDVARALVFLHHECYPPIVHRDVKASNVLLDKDGKARVTDFGLARVVDAGESHVSTMVAGTVGYVAPEYGQTWQATTKGDVYSYGVLIMELASGRRAVDGGEECLVEWARRVMGSKSKDYLHMLITGPALEPGMGEGAEELLEVLKIGIRCTAESPQGRPNMKEVLAMLVGVSFASQTYFKYSASPPSW
ncbi:probable LRR receptor-like serine/threonine-protein kinase At1g74360 [Daucus carota subsp. sativus]|nr:PREDICTED: probable LRR receptor-like serine/threonine-protein kinase At1g74360 [Daucus carota subsp. sativus]